MPKARYRRIAVVVGLVSILPLGCSNDDGVQDTPPPAPQGACCYLDDTRCERRSQAICEGELAGRYLGDGTDCDAEPCKAIAGGACCLPDGACEVLLPEACELASGFFQGAGTTCGEVDCPGDESGACCFPSGSCQVLSGLDCVEFGGTYQGNDTACAPNPC